AEINRVRDVVSEPLPGEIRLQWWRDVLTSGGDTDAVGHPVAGELVKVMKTHALPKDAFDKILLARASDLYDDPISTWTDFEGYAGETGSLIVLLAALICGANHDRALADACGHAGIAIRLSDLMRSFARDAAKGKVFWPEEELARHGADRSKIIRGETHGGLDNALKAVVAKARDHAAKAHAAVSHLPQGTKAAFLPLALVEAYAAKFEMMAADPFKRPPTLSQLRVQWLLWRAR
ncbi:MAG: phytoene/squalene synthase family protein, partial [Pseudomonadota bacterium]